MDLQILLLRMGLKYLGKYLILVQNVSLDLEYDAMIFQYKIYLCMPSLIVHDLIKKDFLSEPFKITYEN